MSEDQDKYIFSTKNIGQCEINAHHFFTCVQENKNNPIKCMAAFDRFEKCCDDVSNLPEPEEHEIHPLVKTLQYYAPRLFTSDMPREKTILAESLGKMMPQIFDPKEDEDD
ncbi:hypothetical protein PPL_01537 [Heterostelium album PN500]|uniref:Uncharacterized protein n=1 Tax=Heterostelium pallidum (strain ATCC 26659 / Pp 5 / PN500) TaxID=670386 RepID=D3AZS4_HETP5|nr:hypothetical protein PPL_01537 [Heterostelium album PN500]EFA84548.1 hypothetical protein PPL_01537 [Heterostelium album PN500]|eukprot:XP_020436661.1 hypothetical protein PPL_01537 [Heterostelium album PN500]